MPLDRIVCASAPDDYLTLDLEPEPAGEPPIAGLRCTQGGSTGSQVNLTPETARALGEALIAWADNPPVRQVDRNGEALEPDDLVVIWHPEGSPIALARWTGEVDRCGYLKLEVVAHRSSTSHGEGVWRPGVLTKVIA